MGFVGTPEVGHEGFKGCISLPYITGSGVTSLRFRSVPPSPKIYLYEIGESPRIYNSKVLTYARKVCITEGEIDCLTAAQAGLQAVGFPGTSSWNPVWSRAFRFRQVTVLADGDEPGEQFAKKIAPEIDDCRCVVLESGMDVSEYVQKYGAAELRKRVGIYD